MSECVDNGNSDKPEKNYAKSLILNCMIIIRLNNENKERCQTDKQKATQTKSLKKSI